MAPSSRVSTPNSDRRAGVQFKCPENNRKARVYKLTPAGRKRLNVETADWQQFSLAIRRLLQGA